MRLEFEPNTASLPIAETDTHSDQHSSLVVELDSLLAQGIKAAQSGDRDRARIILTHAAQIDPRSEDAWMWLASISDYPEELLAFLNNVLDINPNNARAIAWHAATRSLLAKTLVHRAVSAHSAGSHVLAEQCLDQAIEMDDQCELAWYWKASSTDDEKEKIAFLERVLSINPENDDARDTHAALTSAGAQADIARAKSAAVAGKTQDAIQILNVVLQRRPNLAEAWILRSHLSTAIDEKLDSLKKALEIEPENTAARSGFDFLTATIESIKTAVEPSVDSSKIVANVPENITVEAADRSATAETPANDENVLKTEYSPVESLTLDAVGPVSDDPATEVEAVPQAIDMVEGSLSVEMTVESSLGSSTPHDADGVTVETVGSEPESESFMPTGPGCPFCTVTNDDQAFECSSCHAILTLSDIESVLSNPRADRQVIQQAITQMEAEWNFRDFCEDELTALGIGHLNLRNFDDGYKYLQEASRLSPNNVILSGQLNAIAIRMNEIARQTDSDASVTGRTILVVDDSATVRKLISGKLEKAGHNVICAADGVEALARIDESLPDLVLLDITMPRMDGYEVCKNIRSNPAAKDVPVVMISGKDGFFDKVRGRMAGTSGYVTKPFGPETLMKALETYLTPDDPESA